MNDYKETWKSFINRMQGELDNMRYDLELAKGCKSYAEAQFYLKRESDRTGVIEGFHQECSKLGLESEQV